MKGAVIVALPLALAAAGLGQDVQKRPVEAGPVEVGNAPFFQAPTKCEPPSPFSEALNHEAHGTGNKADLWALVMGDRRGHGWTNAAW